jgi:RNA polymerase sigma-70 factor (ECF subfamily)
MYTILIGTFVCRPVARIDLLRQTKAEAMEATITLNRTASPLKETRLINGLKSGDVRAQFQVYKLYYKLIYNKCLLISDDPVIAEDIMHESFLSAFENIDSFSGTMSLPSWIINHIK